jgi:hypothetical protein
MAEHAAVNRRVASSSLARGAKSLRKSQAFLFCKIDYYELK